MREKFRIMMIGNFHGQVEWVGDEFDCYPTKLDIEKCVRKTIEKHEHFNFYYAKVEKIYRLS